MSLLTAIDDLTDEHGYDFSSIEASFNGTIFTGITELSYRQSLTPGKQRGTSAKVKRRTRGEYDASGGFSMWKDEYTNLIAALAALGAAKGKGYGEIAFVLTALYAEGARAITDKLIGCRIVSDEDSHSEGGDGLVTGIEIDIMDISRNGAKLVGESSIKGALVTPIAALSPF